MVATSFKDPGQLDALARRSTRRSPRRSTYAGRESRRLRRARPRTDTIHAWALVEPAARSSCSSTRRTREPTPIEWVGRWRTLEQHWTFDARASTTSRPPGTRSTSRGCSSTRSRSRCCRRSGRSARRSCVAYGFSRFRFPGRNAPVPAHARDDHPAVPGHADAAVRDLHWLGWNGTWLPLIVPHFFANAYNVFLLRQYFLTIPRELDEAAMIDGAGPFRILRR